MRNRKYYDYVPQADFADLGAYGTSGVDVRPPPPSYPTTKREGGVDEETGNIPRLNKLYTGSYSSAADAYFAQYGSGAFPVLIDRGQYGGSVATGGGVLSDVRQHCYLSATGTGTGNSCAAGYLSVDVGGFGSTMLRPFDFQSSAAAAWPAAFRQ